MTFGRDDDAVGGAGAAAGFGGALPTGGRAYLDPVSLSDLCIVSQHRGS
jgi:hypothetical protein